MNTSPPEKQQGNLFTGKLIQWPNSSLSDEHQADIREVLTSVDTYFYESKEVLSEDGQKLFAEFCQGREASSEAIQKLPSRDLSRITKFFTKLFHILNAVEMAEINRRNQSKSRREDSIESSVLRVTKEKALSVQQLIQLLSNVQYVATFTAHPTEAKRPSIITKVAQCVQLLLDKEGERSYLPILLDALLRNPELKRAKPEVQDESRYTLETVLAPTISAITKIHLDLNKLLASADYNEVLDLSLVKLRTWVGGDRDGNPFVTAKETDACLNRYRAKGIETQLQSMETFISKGLLMAEPPDLPPSERLVQSLVKDRADFPDFENGSKLIEYNQFPYYRKLRYLELKLRRSRDDNSYLTGEEFSEDIDILLEALKGSPRGRLLLTMPASVEFFSTAKTLGLHIFTTDIRQHAQIHRDALDELRKILPPKLASLSVEELMTQLDPSTVKIDTSKESKLSEVLKTLEVVKKHQKLSGQSVQSYVISMTTEATDLLTVLLFMKLADLKLHVVPLFETIEDLEKGHLVLSDLLGSAAYQAQLDAMGRFQEIMLGYSDSNKDGGALSATLGINHAIFKLSEFLNKQPNLTYGFFHGRGGSTSRGGGRAGDAIKALSKNSGSSKLRATEQGEVISSRYGDPGIAYRHLNQILAALIGRVADIDMGSDERLEEFHERMDASVKVSQRVYNELVDDEGFFEFFCKVTPIQYIGDLNIGSRPAKRGIYGSGKIKDLRAIPWVFSWQQVRANLTSWYGVGSGLEYFLQQGAKGIQGQQLKDFYREMPVFRVFIDGVERELARARLKVTRRYVENYDPNSPQWKLITDEFDRTTGIVKDIKESSDLLHDSPKIAELISLRNRFTDPLNVIQAELLRRAATELDAEETPIVRHGVLRAISGIAAAMQSTG